GLAGDAEVDAVRMVRSATHGFVTLETSGGFGMPRDVDRSFDRMVDALDAALSALADPGRRTGDHAGPD
ncbi:TetR-like C-terminal domain-containing protein, partial [Georgenia sp. 10Sc9-8]|nr:TetR-like C-terminal domain-containing protein [Georgenia halotolerans]